MKKAQIIDGLVVNIIEVDPASIPDWCASWPTATSTAVIGSTYDSGSGVFERPAAPPVTITASQVNDERDRRLNTTFQFGGKLYDCDPASLSRVTGAAALAGFAMGAGYLAGDYRWHGGEYDFVWIANDNTLTLMDAPTCFAFGQAAAANQSSHVFAAKAIKDMDPIPLDYTDDQWWP